MITSFLIDAGCFCSVITENKKTVQIAHKKQIVLHHDTDIDG